MTRSAVNGNQVRAALEEVDTASFERFGQAFYAAIIGRTFVPLGGLHDGGADGFFEPELFEDAQATSFLQVSKQETFRSKIRLTVKRLRDFGRLVHALVYVTSITVPNADAEEESLSQELQCRIRIRDARYIEVHTNQSDATIAAFEAYLSPAISHFSRPGNSPIGHRAASYTDRTLAVFLRQEVENRRGRVDLLQSVSDSLIVWALSDTDPAKGILLSREEILARIEVALPSTKQFIRGVIDDRLDHLRKRQDGHDRRVRVYKSKGLYCLPHDMRQQIIDENVEDAALKLRVSSLLERRFHTFSNDNERVLTSEVVKACHATLERLFERQGLQIAQFAETGEEDDQLYGNVSDLVIDVIEQNDQVEGQEALRRSVLRVLRGAFYQSTAEEREYLQRLSQTYVLLLLLRNEPQIVEYFRTISSQFNLYIGTDFLVRALSEHYLDVENRTTQNLFAILRGAGAKLILTEKAVEELATHLRRQIFEFSNVYEHVEGRITYEYIEYIDRILIRSYFYA